MIEQKKKKIIITERTENIIGAVVIVVGIAAILITVGWAVPNYYVYFKQTVATAEACVTQQH